MDMHMLFRQLLRQPHTARTLLPPVTRPQSRLQSRTFTLLQPQHPYARHITVPTILRPSFWKSMIPRPLRPSENRRSTSDIPKRQWNPATPYIVLALLVGSQAIQILWLKQERALATRRAEATIGILSEVVERVQRGEDVDVEGMLGSGLEGRERDWAGLLKDIEDEELLFQSSIEKRKLRAAAKTDAPNEVGPPAGEVHNSSEDPMVKVESLDGAKFY